LNYAEILKSNDLLEGHKAAIAEALKVEVCRFVLVVWVSCLVSLARKGNQVTRLKIFTDM
jgi:hypothetical protein